MFQIANKNVVKYGSTGRHLRGYFEIFFHGFIIVSQKFDKILNIKNIEFKPKFWKFFISEKAAAI